MIRFLLFASFRLLISVLRLSRHDYAFRYYAIAPAFFAARVCFI